ncbi:MAG: hypothetical protein R3236_05570, partial [Phycisphaeraceae bacterium]|nr:hypothetical protein [Phycisphaeraceae bacterium]
MGRIPLRFCVLSGFLVLLNILGWLWVRQETLSDFDRSLRVLSASPTQEIQKADRFTLRLSCNLADPQAVGQRIDRPLFQIEPAPDGHWQWAAADRLEYVLTRPLAAGRAYVIRPAAHLEQFTGRTLVGPQKWRFETEPLRVIDCSIRSYEGRNTHIELRFNQPVHPADIAEHVRVLRNGSEPVRFRCLAHQAGKKLLLRVEPGRSRKLLVRIDKRLRGHGADLSLTEPFRRSLSLAEPFAFRYTNVGRPDLDSLQKDGRANLTVDVKFNHDLTEKQSFKRLFRIEPSVDKLKIRHSGDRRYIELTGLFQPGHTYRLRIGQSLLAKNGQTLGIDQQTVFKIPFPDPQIRMDHRRGLLGARGHRQLDLRAVNCPKIRVSAWRIHSNNLLGHLQGRRVDRTGRALKSRIIRTESGRHRPEQFSFNLRPFLGSEKGLYRIRFAHTDRRWISKTATVSISDMALTAKRHRRGLLVWVMGLQEARPVAGATVRAITANNQTVAVGRTDAQGLVDLSVPPRHPDGPVALITAEKDGDL